ncbi:hypothetical protein SERN_0428 [Serinibacter arcticus]|uniref:Uncharacterized protein n=1 Tax=Serinibacter arcticus TaxID=1655435 RepID=A0A4Z1E2U7_9MICO|nr:hypothetical protein SERN_0428 [Serinibacter arcticus]
MSRYRSRPTRRPPCVTRRASAQDLRASRVGRARRRMGA